MAKRTNMWKSNPEITEIKKCSPFEVTLKQLKKYYQPMRTTIYGDGITSRLVWRVSVFLFLMRSDPLVLVPSSPQGVRTLSWIASILWKHLPGDKTGLAVILISQLFTNFQKKSVFLFNLRSYSYVKFANN